MKVSPETAVCDAEADCTHSECHRLTVEKHMVASLVSSVFDSYDTILFALPATAIFRND